MIFFAIHASKALAEKGLLSTGRKFTRYKNPLKPETLEAEWIVTVNKRKTITKDRGSIINE